MDLILELAEQDMAAVVPSVDCGVDFVGLVDGIDCGLVIPEAGKRETEIN